MKRNVSIAIVMAVACLLAAPFAWAGDDREPASGKDKVKKTATEAKAKATKAEAKAKKPDAKAKKESASKGAGLKGYYAIMATEVSLTDQQQQQVADLLAAREKEEAALKEKTGDRVKELSAQIKAAGKDKDKVKAQRAELTEIWANPQKEIRAKYEDKINGVMDPAQKTQWHGYRLFLGEMTRLKKVDVTDEQKSMIRAKADALASSLAGSTPDDKAENQHRLKLHEDVVKEVLTSEQQAAIGVKKPAEPKAKKPAKGDRKLPEPVKNRPE